MKIRKPSNLFSLYPQSIGKELSNIQWELFDNLVKVICVFQLG